MTREEAISILKTYGHNCRCCAKDGLEASEVAIDALEREEIYKSTLFKISETLVDESKLHITPEKACEKIREYLKQKDLKLSQLKEVKE